MPGTLSLNITVNPPPVAGYKACDRSFSVYIQTRPHAMLIHPTSSTHHVYSFILVFRPSNLNSTPSPGLRNLIQSRLHNSSHLHSMSSPLRAFSTNLGSKLHIFNKPRYQPRIFIQLRPYARIFIQPRPVLCLDWIRGKSGRGSENG